MDKIRTRKKTRVLTLILAAALCFSNHFTLVIHAENTTETKKKLEDDLSKLKKDKNTISNELSAATASLQSTVTEIRSTQQELGIAKARAVGQYELMKKRVKYIYESCSGDYVSMLLGAESMTELLNRADFISSISEYDRNMLEKLQKIQSDVEVKEKLLIAQQQNLNIQKKDLSAKYQTLTAMVSDASENLAAYQRQLDEAKAAEQASNEILNESKPVEKPEKQDSKPEEKPDTKPDKEPEKPDKPAPPADSSDLALFAGILECEAGSTNYNGILAVATVIMNRVESPRYPNSLKGVIYQSGQFSPSWTGRLDTVLARGPKPLCYTIAKAALSGKRYQPVIHCYSFNYTGSGVTGIDVGGNTFY